MNRNEQRNKKHKDKLTPTRIKTRPGIFKGQTQTRTLTNNNHFVIVSCERWKQSYLTVVDETDGGEVAQVLDRHEAFLPCRLTITSQKKSLYSSESVLIYMLPNQTSFI
jgi:hypothetical protein